MGLLLYNQPSLVKRRIKQTAKNKKQHACTFCEVPRTWHKFGTKAGSGNNVFSCRVAWKKNKKKFIQVLESLRVSRGLKSPMHDWPVCSYLVEGVSWLQKHFLPNPGPKFGCSINNQMRQLEWMHFKSTGTEMIYRKCHKFQHQNELKITDICLQSCLYFILGHTLLYYKGPLLCMTRVMSILAINFTSHCCNHYLMQFIHTYIITADKKNG